MASAAEQIEATDGADCRCICGSLVARLVDGGVELKCRRCKRIHVVALPTVDALPTVVATLGLDVDSIPTKPAAREALLEAPLEASGPEPRARLEAANESANQ